MLAGIRAAEKLVGLDGVEFDLRMHSGECIDVPAAAFDVVYMREVLHHIRDLDGFLAEVVRVLRPGGLLVCLRDVVIWNEDQRQSFFRDHPLNHITQDEGCYHLQEYLDAFARAGLETFRLLNPSDSPINAYPNRLADIPPFNEESARQRSNGYDLFSFFLQKPGTP
jgi:SAM-dependent methyltransferase